MSTRNSTGRGRTATGENGTAGNPAEPDLATIVRLFKTAAAAEAEAEAKQDTADKAWEVAISKRWDSADALALIPYAKSGGPQPTVTIKQVATELTADVRWLTRLRKTALDFPVGVRVPGWSVSAHIRAYNKYKSVEAARGALKSESPSSYEMRSAKAHQAGIPSAFAKKAMKDANLDKKVVEDMAEEDQDTLTAHVLRGLKASDSAAQQYIMRTYLEWSAQDSSDDDDEQEDDTDADEQGEGSEEEQGDGSDSTESEEGSGSTSTGKKSKQKESQETKAKRKERQKSKAKNQTDDKTKEDLRNEQLRSLLMFAVRGHGGLLAAAGWLDAITHVKWLSRDEYDCFMPLMEEVPRLAEQVREWGDSLDVLPDLPDDAVTLDNELSDFLKGAL